MPVSTSDGPEVIAEFFEYIYGPDEGYIYIARKGLADSREWKQDFFSWPTEKNEAAQFVVDNRSKWEVYMGPALFSSPGKADKPRVKSARVYWCEFDGSVPESLERLPRPTMRILSSQEGHEHWYWRLDKSVEPDQLELVNRAITYLLRADASGWDSTQVLRPPGTFNHKRKRDVILVESDEVQLDPALFTGLPQPPAPVEIQQPESIPGVAEVVARYKFDQDTYDLFSKGVPVGHRSTAQMQLGHILAEMGMTNEEMLSVLLNADDRWGKFSGRDDQVKRLLEIVTRAREKHPYDQEIIIEGYEDSSVETRIRPYNFLELLHVDVHLEWIWKDYLQEDGYLLLAGPSQVGKTQFTIDAACHFALGVPFLEETVKETKIGLLSLEMGLTDIKHFIEKQQGRWSEQEQQRLAEMFYIWPMGEPIDLSTDRNISVLDQWIGDYGLGGIMIDSLGEATAESLSDEQFRLFFDAFTKLRMRHHCFTWFIHHMRKGDGSRKPNKLTDVYGSQYITSKASTVLVLWEGPRPNLVEVRPLKVRLAPRKIPFLVERDGNLHFQHSTSEFSIEIVDDHSGRLGALESRPQSPTEAPSDATAGDTAAFDNAPGPTPGLTY